MNNQQIDQLSSSKWTINLAVYANTPFILAMSATNGIYSMITSNASASFTFPASLEVIDLIENELRMDAKEISSLFQNGFDGISNILNNLAGQKTTTRDVKSLLEQAISPNDLDVPYQNQEGVDYAASLLNAPVLITGNSFVQIVVSDTLNNYHVGYAPYNVKSGRSFSNPGNSGEIDDPSDKYYLENLNNCITPYQLNSYLNSISQFLISSSIGNPQDYGSVGYFTTIYTAELIRYVMTDYSQKNIWALDLAKVSYLASYVNISGMLILNGAFVQGALTDYANKGSIGDYSSDISQLSTLITAFLSNNYSILIQNIENIVFGGGEDIFQDMLIYIVNPNINLDQKTQRVLIENMNKLIEIITNETNNITQFINENYS